MIPNKYCIIIRPSARGSYPLLNPRFVAQDEVRGTECLIVQVLSRGDNGSIDRQLGTFTPTPACTLVAKPPGSPKSYRYHGVFILPLHFLGKPDKQEIDFASLKMPLTQVLDLLRQPARC
jgi:hypothetical protein